MEKMDENRLVNSQASDTEKALFLTKVGDRRMIMDREELRASIPREVEEDDGEEEEAHDEFDAAETLDLACDFLLTRCLVAIVSGNLAGVTRATIEDTLDHLAALDVVNDPNGSFAIAYERLGRQDRHEKMLIDTLAAFDEYEKRQERKTKCQEN